MESNKGFFRGSFDSVDGRHPKQPPGMYKTPEIMRYTTYWCRIGNLLRRVKGRNQYSLAGAFRS